MPMTARQMKKLLEQNGFVCVRQRGSHQQYQKGDVTTTLPIHRGDLKKNIEKNILKAIEQGKTKGL